MVLLKARAQLFPPTDQVHMFRHRLGGDGRGRNLDCRRMIRAGWVASLFVWLVAVRCSSGADDSAAVPVGGGELITCWNLSRSINEPNRARATGRARRRGLGQAAAELAGGRFKFRDWPNARSTSKMLLNFRKFRGRRRPAAGRLARSLSDSGGRAWRGLVGRATLGPNEGISWRRAPDSSVVYWLNESGAHKSRPAHICRQ